VDGAPADFIEPVRQAVWSVDPSQPIAEMGSMSALVGSWVAIPRATRALLSTLAALSLLLAAVGVFGVVAFAVRSRRSELGVRLALGASPDRLMVEVARTVAPVATLGIVVGVAGGLVGAESARAVLYDVSPTDLPSVAGAVAALVAAAAVATWLPAHRISRIDPTEAIRAE
jgi:ABC-type antimicrobial peptide transport system permease subunit